MTVSSETLRSISTPERLETRLGRLEFRDGVPSGVTVETLYDHLDFVHGLNVFLNGFPGASTYAMRKGFHEAGANDNEVIIFSEMMGSESLFLTANADTIYFVAMVDLTSGPMVVETPPQALAVFDDMWWQWIVDFGLSGPDRGQGGRFLLDPAGLRRPAARQRLSPRALAHNAGNDARPLVPGGRPDPAPAVELIKSTLKIYPYDQGGFGTSIATLLEGGKRRPRPAAPVPETTFVEGSGNVFNTIPPSDFGFFELLNELVQENPPVPTDAELMGQLAAIGIVKGKPFEPDVRMRRILEDAAAVGSATSRALVFDARASEGFEYYDGSAWLSNLWIGGYTFETPPPLVTPDGIEPLPATGVKAAHARTAFFYGFTGITPAMCMRLTGLGSQYIMLYKDSDGNHLDGAMNYQVNLPPDIPAARFWSLTAYDNRHARCSTRHSASHESGARPTPRRRRPRTQTVRRPSRSVRNDRQTAPRATGSRPTDGQGLVPDPAALQPAGVILRQELATQRGRALASTARTPSEDLPRPKGNPCPPNETPVLDLLASMTAESIAVSASIRTSSCLFASLRLPRSMPRPCRT